ncbi:MAG: c-type cytochrome domain-containing protein, partial [Anaerolineae bacterium]
GLLTEGQIDELVTFITSWKGALSTASAEGGLKTGVGEDVREPQTSASSVEPSNEVSGQLPSFTEDILPLLQSKCSACHGNLGGWSAASYDEVINSGDSGPAVVPGDAEGSLLLQKLKDTQTIGGPMPPSQLLSDEEIALVEEWIAAGAPDN